MPQKRGGYKTSENVTSGMRKYRKRAANRKLVVNSALQPIPSDTLQR